MPIPDVSDRSLGELVSLQGRTAVVTGGARGLGRAIARRLAEAGASLVIGDLIEAGARSVADDLAATFGVTALAMPLDVADSASIAALADIAVNQLGGIDIWVNNAGIYPSTPTLEMSDDEWNRVVRINLNGTFFGCRERVRARVTGKLFERWPASRSPNWPVSRSSARWGWAAPRSPSRRRCGLMPRSATTRG